MEPHPFYIGGTANGIVVEGKHTDAVIDYIAGIAGHSDDFAQQVVDIGIIGTPLDAVDAIPGFEAVQGQFEIFIGRLQGYRCYRTVRVFEGKAISLCIINGLFGAYNTLSFHYHRATTTERVCRQD